MDWSDTSRVVARLAHWQHTRNFVAIGNLGEHVTGRILVFLDYHLLGAQDDLLGFVPEVLGHPTTAKPEDFVAIDPDGRLTTVNSKASISARSCRLTAAGDLTPPRISRGQRALDYTTTRARLVSPLDGDAYSHVVKVDLVHMRAQIFDIDDAGALTCIGTPHDVSATVTAILTEFPDAMPPPHIHDLQ